MSSSSRRSERREEEEEDGETTSSNTMDYEKLFAGVQIIRGPLQLKRPLQRGFAHDEEEEDDGMTDAQRQAEQAKEKRMIEAAARDFSYKEKIEQFNAKLAKMSDHNEMPRISGQ